MPYPVRQYTTRRSLLSKYNTALHYKLKCNFITSVRKVRLKMRLFWTCHPCHDQSGLGQEASA